MTPATDTWGRRRLLIAIGLAAALAVALLIAAIANSGSDEPAGTAADGFQPVYEDLEQRREDAGVSTMGDPADPDAHLHPRTRLYANGERIQVPVNIGIDPTEPGEQMASLHTHETDGTIHMEGISEATLGQFFEIWGVPFSETQLGPYETGNGRDLRMWIDGQPSREFTGLPLRDRQEVIIAFGTEAELAAVAP